MSVPLPPDLLAHPTHTAPGSATTLISTEWPCATRNIAGQPLNPQWALQTLQERHTVSTAQSPMLTVPTAVQLALCHNPQVRASWSAIAQQAAQLGQAQSAYWPQLSAGIARQRSHLSYDTSSQSPTTIWATSQNAQLSWRLWDFGARSARTGAATAQLQAALYSQDATIQNALTEVLHTYAQAQAAHARLQTQRHLLPLAERVVQAAKRRQQGGAGSGSDTLQAQAAQARIQLEQSRSQGELDKTTAQLTYLLGLPPGTAFQLEPIHAPTVQTVSQKTSQNEAEQLLHQPLDAWLEQARQTHPAIAAAKAQWQAAQASLKVTQSEGMPSVDLNLAHYRNGRPNTDITSNRSRENVIGINLTIPLFDGFNTTYKVRAAQALVEQKAIEYQATEQQTLQELVQLYAEAKATLTNLRMAQNLSAAAQQVAHSTQRQFENGATDIVQLNQSLSSLHQAQLDLAQSQAEWNRARLRLWLYDRPQPLAR
ncbi:TolC family protein [Ottowia sp.]|uniref:TolC family protein n=1 Tax=Ottowia sp. TaxID=1898956 RepID=UPI003A8BBBB5